MESVLGRDIKRKEAYDKVTGAARYSGDFTRAGIWHAELCISHYAHAKITEIDLTQAFTVPGVKKIITGADINILTGPQLEDRPPIARGKVRYYGEPVAMVIADCEQNARAAAEKIRPIYEPLPAVNSVREAMCENPVIIHENMGLYKKAADDVYPAPGTNICNSVKIRKGDMQSGWNESEVVIEGSFFLPRSDHAAMETRCAQCEIMPDGNVLITSSTQAPYSVRQKLSEYFGITEGNIIVNVPFVGGGFGGKAAVELEILAYIASKAADGHAVKIVNGREKDMVTSPCRLGLDAKITLGAKKDGKITAASFCYFADCGAYCDISPRMTKAMAVDCAGPYNIENISCDALCVYTNRPFATSFRGFGHASPAFCLERMLDKLALALNADPLELRRKNAIKEGDLTPTQVKVTRSNTGDFSLCLDKLKSLINWDEGRLIPAGDGLLRAKGVGCFIKTSNSPIDAVSGVFLSLNKDGSINLNCGAVECGPGMKTSAAQILAEKMKMSIERIHVKMDTDTQTSPVHWKTVASMTTFMVGRAVLSAAEDLISQLLDAASKVMKCPAEDLDIAGERVFLKRDPEIYTEFQDISLGVKYADGNSVGGQILGRGGYIMSHLTPLDVQTGRGKPGPYWTPGAQAVEIEYDTARCTYRVLKAATVVDAGRVLNPKTVKGVLMGGMCMGLGLGMCEAFDFDASGAAENTSFRTYKMLRCGDTPNYLIDFVETPNLEAPYGVRGLAEHAVIGIPAALANALSLASGTDISTIPVTPEKIWRQRTGAPS